MGGLEHERQAGRLSGSYLLFFHRLVVLRYNLFDNSKLET